MTTTSGFARHSPRYVGDVTELTQTANSSAPSIEWPVPQTNDEAIDSRNNAAFDRKR